MVAAPAQLSRQQAAGAIRQRAAELGFDTVGFARADEPLERDHGHYEAFIDAGMHGDMAYLAKNRQVRRQLDGDGILLGARTVVCLARRYARGEAAERDDPPLAQGVARYARGRDYHGHLRKRTGKLARFVRERFGEAARPLCDTAPVLERAWAARAGLGFIGKNGMLIVPGQGSYCLLAEVVTTLALPAEAYGSAMAERCGSCTACLDVCPTQAFAAPFVLDASRCVAFFTIESRGLPEVREAEQIGERLFGCDDCQQVCPYNRVAPAPPDATEPYRPLPRWDEATLEQLVDGDEAAFARLTEGSPLRRARRFGLARNALVVAAARARRGDETARALIERSRRHPDEALAAFARRLAEGA